MEKLQETPVSITRSPSTVPVDAAATSVAPPTTAGGAGSAPAGGDAVTTAPSATIAPTTTAAATTTVAAPTTVGGPNRAEEAFSKVSGYSIVQVSADQESQQQALVAQVVQKGFVASASAHEVQDLAAAAPRMLVIAIALLPGQGPEGAALAGNIIKQAVPDAAGKSITIAGEPGVLASGAQNEVIEWSNDELVLLFVGLPGDDKDNLAMAEAFVTANH